MCSASFFSSLCLFHYLIPIRLNQHHIIEAEVKDTGEDLSIPQSSHSKIELEYAEVRYRNTNNPVPCHSYHRCKTLSTQASDYTSSHTLKTVKEDKNVENWYTPKDNSFNIDIIGKDSCNLLLEESYN